MALITWSPTDKSDKCILSNNNLSTDFTGIGAVRATNFKTSGKWYWEIAVNGININATTIGIASENMVLGGYVGANQEGRSYYPDGRRFPIIPYDSRYGEPYNRGSVIGVAINLDSNPKTLIFYNNGASQGVAYSDFDNWGKVFASMGGGASAGGGGVTANFGATPFKYDVPQGYLPYDAENASWLNPTRYLLKQNNKILTIESNNLIETVLQEPLSRVDFEALGFGELDLILGKNVGSMKLLINPQTNDVISKLNIEAIPKSQLILSKDDILLRMANKIDNFQIYSNQTIPENIKIIFSVDSGVAWQTFDNDLAQFKEISSIEDLEEVKLQGMTVSTFNSIGLKWNDVIKDGRIKFGYYLDIDEVTDIAEIDKLEVTIETTGRWRKSKKVRDYDYDYDNETLSVSLYKDGSYKINYAE